MAEHSIVWDPEHRCWRVYRDRELIATRRWLHEAERFVIEDES